jgi:PAS domain-containing protein
MLNMEMKHENSSSLVNAIQLLSKINDPRIDLNEGIDRFLEGLARIFNNEYAILVLTDPEGGPTADRKLCTTTTPVPLTDQVNFTSGILFQSYQDLKLMVVDQANEKANPAVDAPDETSVRSVACAPLIYHSALFGILAIGNFPSESFTEEARVVFAHLLDSLAARIHSSKLIEELQASNTELLTTQQQLVHSRNTLRTLFDNIPDSFYIVDENYFLVAINQSRAERSGVTPQQVVGQHCYEGLYHFNSPARAAWCKRRCRPEPPPFARSICCKKITAPRMGDPDLPGAGRGKPPAPGDLAGAEHYRKAAHGSRADPEREAGRGGTVGRRRGA